MRTFKDIKDLSAEFKQNWLKYLVLFMSLDILNQFVFIPLFRLITTFVLQMGAIPFVSYSNLQIILMTHPFVVLALIIELLVLLIIIYAQFAFLIWMIKENFAVKSSLKKMVRNLRHLRPGSLPLLASYFLLIIPFANIIFRTPLLAKIKIPEFIIDYLTRTWWLALILLIFYAVIFVLGLRYLLTLPIMIIQKVTTRQAMKQSSRVMKQKWRQVLVLLLLLGLITFILMLVLFGTTCLFQMLWDLLPGKFALVLATINLSVLQLISEVILIWSSTISLLFLLKQDKVEKTNIEQKHSRSLIGIIALVFVVAAAGIVFSNVLYLEGWSSHRPVTISHRGVNDENGVQNTIEALKKTSKYHPDFVEIDVHETKDNQFVVMHDENLKELTGVDKKPKELTLKQLQKLTVKENGNKDKLVSLDQYIAAARKLDQKLLIEVKTTPQDSRRFLTNFNRRYSPIILSHGYQVQSLDYRVVSELHRINPQLEVLYIQPYNFSYPHSVADGYSMEYSTLDSDFIWQAHLQNHVVYAWTVNDEAIMKRMMYEHIDGIITDNVALLNRSIKEFEANKSYANRILNYIVAFPVLD